MVDNNLRELRKAKKMSRRELAEKSGVSECGIKFYEDGTNRLQEAKYRIVYALSKALGCKINKLFEGKIILITTTKGGDDLNDLEKDLLIIKKVIDKNGY